MKKIYGFFWFTLVVCAVLLSSCQEDEKSPATPGTVRFTLRQKAVGANGRTTQNLPEGARLYVSVENTAGEQIYNLKEVTLVSMGDYVISEPLAFNTGDYVLTEFMVANEQVSYVTPREGSPLAQWVDDPLPIAFSVQDNIIAGLDVQVLPFDDDHTPEDFGYIGFDIVVAPYPYFNLSVFTPTGDAFEFIPVHAYILEGDDTIYNEVLPAGTNKIAFVGDMQTIYRLVLEQPGYSRYVMYFSLPTLLDGLASLGKRALEVTLQPALTFATWSNRGAAFSFYGSSTEELTVDWGDGTVEPLVPPLENYAEHEYDGSQERYFVSVYGNDLSNIDELGFYYDFGSLDEITLDHLPALKTFRLGFAQAPSVVDFTHNPVIEDIQLIAANARAIVLAEDATVGQILLMGNNNTFLQSSLDHVIDVSYRAAVEGRQPVGTLGLVTLYTAPPRLIVTPSPDALEKLRALRDVYGWSISPDDF